MTQLLSPLSVEIDEGVDEVGDARTDVEEVDQLVVEVEVEQVRHVQLPRLLLLNARESVHH